MAKTKEFNDKDYSVTKVNTEIGLIQETELKLRLSSKTMALLIQHPLITILASSLTNPTLIGIYAKSYRPEFH